jgi:hypothetical protein
VFRVKLSIIIPYTLLKGITSLSMVPECSLSYFCAFPQNLCHSPNLRGGPQNLASSLGRFTPKLNLIDIVVQPQNLYKTRVYPKTNWEPLQEPEYNPETFAKTSYSQPEIVPKTGGQRALNSILMLNHS